MLTIVLEDISNIRNEIVTTDNDSNDKSYNHLHCRCRCSDRDLEILFEYYGLRDIALGRLESYVDKWTDQ